MDYDAKSVGFRSSEEHQLWMAQQVRADSTRSAAVDPTYFWRICGGNTPRGVKLQLINKAAGVAVYGTWSPGSGFTHWAPLPKFPPGD